MKKIVPFKKEIVFNDSLSEITSISLEHTLKCIDNSVVGNFYITGEYKMTATSTDTEKFSYDLPFEIDLNEKYNLDNVITDINDFYYEIINDSILKVNIEVVIDNIEEIKEEIEPIEPIEPIIKPEEKQSKTLERCIESELPNIFDNLSSEETYRSYTVYIVRENDTLEVILNKYNVTKEELEDYNDLKEIKIGDKIIIPNV